MVIGADGLHSWVARVVRPERYYDKPQLLCGYYTYWSGLPMHGRFEGTVALRRRASSPPPQCERTPLKDLGNRDKPDIEGPCCAHLDQ